MNKKTMLVGVAVISLIALAALMAAVIGIFLWKIGVFEVGYDADVVGHEPISTEEVTITTDKTEYEQGRDMKITLTNNHKESIFSHAASFTPDAFIVSIERKKIDETWEELPVRCAWPECDIDFDRPAETKSGKSETFYWKPTIHFNGKDESAGQGVYRLNATYQIESGGEWETIHSNEFTIKGQITKEQAIEIAKSTEEVREFLKLYPDARIHVQISVVGCIEDVVKGGGGCYHKVSPYWLVMVYYDRDNVIDPTELYLEEKIPFVRIAIHEYSGEILAKYPKLEYIKNFRYCESDGDCEVPDDHCGFWTVSGCANFMYKPKQSFKDCDGHGYSWDEINCKCLNNACTAEDKPKQITESQAIAIANATDEVREFLKLYPDATLDVWESNTGCVEDIVKGVGGCRHRVPPYWLVMYYHDENDIVNNRKLYLEEKIPFIRIAIDSQTGEILVKYPKLEYIKNFRYCESDGDCNCAHICHGCANFINTYRISQLESPICEPVCNPTINSDCKCLNNTCTTR